MADAMNICVPIYNEPIEDLLAQLDEQKQKTPEVLFNIFLIDDASPDLTIREENEAAAKKYGATYIQQGKNAGRSKTRNAFLKVTNAPWLLFIDGDSVPVTENFLNLYTRCFKNNPEVSVIYGGTQYPSAVDDDHRLHHAYATDREALPVAERRKNPIRTFHANNFLIRRDVLHAYPFEEVLTHYGHEDSLLAIRLAMAGIQVDHISNPVYHKGLEKNKDFLQKTQQAIRHLPHIAHCLPTGTLEKYSALWKWYLRGRLFWSQRWFSSCTEAWINRREEEMRAGIYHPRRFALYKLIYLLQVDPLSRMHS
jgi:glycosyltransferase involved in cell wall biosynthesis